jgi:hypothetical protein
MIKMTVVMKTFLLELVWLNLQVAILGKAAILETTWMVMEVPHQAAPQQKDGRKLMFQKFKIYIEMTVSMRSPRTNLSEK